MLTNIFLFSNCILTKCFELHLQDGGATPVAEGDPDGDDDPVAAAPLAMANTNTTHTSVRVIQQFIY